MQCKICSKMFTPRARVKITDVCFDCIIEKSQGNVDVNDIDVSKGQAEMLKNIARSVPKNKDLSKFSLQKALRDQPEKIHFIQDNWGSQEYFINLVLDDKPSNPISLIMYFLNMKKNLGFVPTKEKMKEISKFYLSEYEYKFGSWEKFLDLLGFDPWYKEEIKEKPKPKKFKLKTLDTIKVNSEDYFKENDSEEEIINKVNTLREQIIKICEKKDLEEDYLDFSHKEMFQLLEQYLNALPNDKKYSDVNYFL